jgi:hypothetical protein
MDLQIIRTQNEEWEAWRKICRVMAETLGITEEELNKPKYRIIFVMIERWAYFDRERRRAFLEYGNESDKKYATSLGLFWEGDEK